MYDLTSSMFYKAKFNITNCDLDKTDLLWKVVMDIRSWITRKLNKSGTTIVTNEIGKWTGFKLGGKLYDLTDQNRFFAESALHHSASDDKISWACMIIEKPDPLIGCAPREWITEIGFQSNGSNEAEISYVVTYNDAAGFIGPCMDEPGISVPSVIRMLLSDSKIRCTIGSTPINLQPKLLCVGDFPLFESILLDENREVPIVYISPINQTEDEKQSANLVNAYEVARAVAANALVYYATDPNFSSEMCYLGKSDYTCAGGAIRIYFPHINYEQRADGYRHRFISASTIKEHGATYTYKVLRRAIAQDVHYYEKLFRLVNCKNLISEEKHREKIEAVRKKGETSVDEAIKEFLKESDRCQVAESRICELRDELDDAQRDNNGLRLQIQSQSDIYTRCQNLEESLKRIRNIPEFPDTPMKVMQFYHSVYADRITFTERGLKSVENCDKKCGMLWEIFYYIVHDLYDLLQQSPATAYKQFQERTGWECSRGEGRMTHKSNKLMRNYSDTYDGHEIDVEAHIKRGNKDSDPNSVRIFFAYNPDVAPQIIISYVGKHLDNYSTQKIH